MDIKTLVIGLVVGAAAGGAAAAKAGPARKVFNAPGKNPELPFSDGVLVGDTLYLAGKIGIDPKTGKAPADVEAEVKLVMDSMKATLEQAGFTMDDLVSVTVFCPDLSLYDRFNKIYRSYFKKELPARAFIGSGKLLRDGRFELVGTAVRR